MCPFPHSHSCPNMEFPCNQPKSPHLHLVGRGQLQPTTTLIAEVQKGETHTHRGECVMVDEKRKLVTKAPCMTCFGKRTLLCAEPLDCLRTCPVPDPCLSDDPPPC